MEMLAIPLAIAASAAWAIGMTVAKPALPSIDRLTYTLYRWMLVALLALLYGAARGTLHFPGGWPVAMAALSGFLDAAVGGFVFLMAMQRTTAYQATTLASTAPLWGVLSAMLLLGESPHWTVFAAAILVVAGSVFLVGRKQDRNQTALLGAILALLTAALWGFSETVPAKLALEGGLSPETLLLVFSLAGMSGSLLLIPFLRHRIPRRTSPRGVMLVALSAAGGAFLGGLLWLNSLSLAPASLISPIRGSTLLFAFVYSVVFLRERPTRRSMVGVLLVLGGVLLVSFAN